MGQYPDHVLALAHPGQSFGRATHGAQTVGDFGRAVDVAGGDAGPLGVSDVYHAIGVGRRGIVGDVDINATAKAGFIHDDPFSSGAFPNTRLLAGAPGDNTVIPIGIIRKDQVKGRKA